MIKSCKYICVLQKCRQVKKAPGVLIFKITEDNLSEVHIVRNHVSSVIFLLKDMCQHWSRETPHKCM